MTPIQTQFKGTRDQSGSNGAYTFKLLKREGQVAMFEKQNPEHKSKTAHYEVVILRKVPERRFPNGIVTPPHESMPSPEEWGTSGWSLAGLGRALTVFDREARRASEPSR